MENYKGFRIEQTENGYRVTCDDGTDKHTHLKNKAFCFKLIDMVYGRKIPTRVSNYVLESCIRLSDNEKYIHRICGLLESRKRKGKKLPYVNPGIKKSF